MNVVNDYIKNLPPEQAQLQIKIIKKSIEICINDKQNKNHNLETMIYIEKKLIDYYYELDEYIKFFPEFII